MRSQLRNKVLGLLTTLTLFSCAKGEDPVHTGINPKPAECTSEVVNLHKNLQNQLKTYRIIKSSTNEKALKNSCLKYQKAMLEISACETEDSKTQEKVTLLFAAEAEACTKVGADPAKMAAEGKNPGKDPGPATPGTRPPTLPTGPADPTVLNSASKGLSITVLQADIISDLISSGTGVVISRGQVIRGYKDIDKEFGYCLVSSSRSEKKVKAAQVLRFPQILNTEGQPNVFVALSKDGDLRLSCGYVKKTSWTVQDLAEIFGASARIEALR